MTSDIDYTLTQLLIDITSSVNEGSDASENTSKSEITDVDVEIGTDSDEDMDIVTEVSVEFNRGKVIKQV